MAKVYTLIRKTPSVHCGLKTSQSGGHLGNDGRFTVVKYALVQNAFLRLGKANLRYEGQKIGVQVRDLVKPMQIRHGMEGPSRTLIVRARIFEALGARSFLHVSQVGLHPDLEIKA